MKCDACVERCPKADMAHEAAKGRMYATNEFIALQKKIEDGQLVEVVRCKDCVNGYMSRGFFLCCSSGMVVNVNHFCSYGERKDNAEHD